MDETVVSFDGNTEDVELDPIDEDEKQKEPRTRLKSTLHKTDESGRKIKGRGFGQDSTIEVNERYSGKGKEWESIGDESLKGPLRSIEGYILFITGIHEEASEDDLLDKFSECGEVKNIQLPLDRRTGFVKGYALIEYETKEEAESAIKSLDNSEFMESTVHVDWAFTHGSMRTKSRNVSRGSKKYNRH